MRAQLTLALLMLCGLRGICSLPTEAPVKFMSSDEWDEVKTRLEITKGLFDEEDSHFRVLYAEKMVVTDNYGGRDYKFEGLRVSKTNCTMEKALEHIKEGRRVLEKSCPFKNDSTMMYILKGQIHKDRLTGCYSLLYPVKVEAEKTSSKK